MLILGVIASLTIPSLIQNTHKKEEVVKIKKGLSVLNQALASHYALTGEDLSNADSIGEDEWKIQDSEWITNLLKKHITMTESYDGGGSRGGFITPDGLRYVFDSGNYQGRNLTFYIVTKPKNSEDDSTSCGDFDVPGFTINCTPGSLGNLTGSYSIECTEHRCVPTAQTAAIINSTDPTKAE